MAGRGADREIVVVDEANSPIGTATRRRMHTDRLVHRAIHGLVYDEVGRVYLSQRDDVVGRDQLDVSVTEHVWPGESYEETARRALARRLGIPGADALEALSEVFRDCDVHDGGADYEGASIVDDRWMQIFAARLRGRIEFDRRVYKGGEWRRLSEVDELIATEPERFTPHFRKDWARVRDLLEAIVRRAVR